MVHATLKAPLGKSEESDSAGQGVQDTLVSLVVPMPLPGSWTLQISVRDSGLLVGWSSVAEVKLGG